MFLGLSVKGARDAGHGQDAWRKAPIIFAMANPDPEITPEDVKAVRPDAIVATGRSDYPNQVNNVLGFPYIFRGALDVRARTINEEMKIAAAHALAELAREDVPDEVAAAYRGARPVYGPDYIIPVPFDPRLISRVSSRGCRSGDEERAWRASRSRISTPTASSFRRGSIRRPLCSRRITASVRANPKRVVFAEGEEESRHPRRGRVPEFGPRQGDPGRARGDGARRHPRARRRDEPPLEIRVPHSAAGSRALYRGALQAAAAARRALSRLRAHGDQRPQRLSPPRCWRRAMPTPW